MADFRLKMGETVDINTSISGGADDSGVTYEVAAGFTSLASVNAATGVVTPIAPGMVVINAKNSSNVVVRSISIEIVTAAQATLEADISGGATAVNASAAPTGTSVPQNIAKKGFNLKNTTTNVVSAAGSLPPISGLAFGTSATNDQTAGSEGSTEADMSGGSGSGSSGTTFGSGGSGTGDSGSGNQSAGSGSSGSGDVHFGSM